MPKIGAYLIKILQFPVSYLLYASKTHFEGYLRQFSFQSILHRELHFYIQAEDLVEHIGTGEVGDEHTEGDGHQQQRLKLLYNAQIQQHAGDAQHDEAAPVAVLGKEVEAGVL